LENLSTVCDIVEISSGNWKDVRLQLE